MTTDWEQQLAADLSKKYRIEPVQALTYLASQLATAHPLSTYVREHRDDPKLMRSREFKLFSKKVRKELYYSLRQYSRSDYDLATDLVQLEHLRRKGLSWNNIHVQAIVHKFLRQHVSTNERLAAHEVFAEQLKPVYRAAETIVDLGSGLYPLQFPYNDAPVLRQYVAVEPQQSSLDVLRVWREFFPDVAKILPVRLTPETLAELWMSYPQPDVVLMFKLIPVVQRQQAELIPLLAQSPGQKLVLTASSQAMAKRQSIRHREDKALQEFITLTNRPVVKKIEIATEFGYVLGPRSYARSNSEQRG